MTRKDKYLLLLLFNFIAIVLTLPQKKQRPEDIGIFQQLQQPRQIQESSRFRKAAYHETQTSQPHPKSKRPIPIFKSKIGGLELPNNATSIRQNIVDTFSCANRIYGYYADIENECQLFHVCLPQVRGAIRWSFICPAETVFNQATFVCTRTENSIPCEESENFYFLNEDIGKENENYDESTRIPVDAQIDETIKPYLKTNKIFNRELALKAFKNH